MAKLLQKYYAQPDGRFYADEYYRVLTSKDATVHTESDFLDYGEIELRILEDKDFKKRVAMFRRSGIKYTTGATSELRFALLVCSP